MDSLTPGNFEINLCYSMYQCSFSFYCSVGIALYKYTMYHLHLPLDAQLGYFQVGPIRNNAAISIHIQDCV